MKLSRTLPLAQKTQTFLTSERRLDDIKWTTNQSYFHWLQQAVELMHISSGLKNVNIFIHSIWVGGQEVSNATCSCGDGFTNQAGAGAEPTWSFAESPGSCTQPANWGLYNQWWSTPHASCQQLLWSGKPNLCIILSPAMIFSSYCSLQNYSPYHDV